MVQITSALVGVALVISAVFVPMAFMGGSSGVIFRQFSITIVTAMTLSVIVAIVLTPAMCATMLPLEAHIHLRDGVTIRADIYRPVGEGKVPVIIGWSSYGKRASWLTNDVFGHPTRMDVPLAWEDGLNKFEGPNPAYWVARGYAIIAPDSRGVFMSEGDIPAWGTQDAQDEYDVIEWAAIQPWSNGKVGLTGTSMLAISQWAVSALQPPHLAAIAPTEGASDIYRDSLSRGGMPEVMFAGQIFAHVYGNGRTEDLAAMINKYPLYNTYWADKATDLKRINVPAYVVASWTNLVHTGGTFRAWENIASDEKWLRVHNTHEWNDYYNPENVEELRRFFDHYLKGVENGWQATPAVRLSVLDPGNTDTVKAHKQGKMSVGGYLMPNSIASYTPDELRFLVREAVRAELSAFVPKREKQEVFNEKQAADYIGQKPGTLRQWRTLSKGPAYHKKERRVFYKKSDLDAWMAQGRTFTSETPDAPY